MVYEMRKAENSKHECPKCHGHLTVKFGRFRGEPRRRCNECGKVFFVKETTESGTFIRVGTGDGRSCTVKIDKPYDEIRLSDILDKLPEKRIVGWCKITD